jgi:cobalt-precorrin-5B (C1)-methyltransferase
MMDMGDFAGGLLKYVREHPVDRITIGGGFGKITKLAQGAMDLHSGRSQVDFEWLAKFAPQNLHKEVKTANTAQQVLEMLGTGLASQVAGEAKLEVEKILRGAPVATDVMIVDRAGKIIAHAE